MCTLLLHDEMDTLYVHANLADLFTVTSNLSYYAFETTLFSNTKSLDKLTEIADVATRIDFKF